MKLLLSKKEYLQLIYGQIRKEDADRWSKAVAQGFPPACYTMLLTLGGKESAEIRRQPLEIAG